MTKVVRTRAVSFIRQMAAGRTKPCLMLCEDEQGNQEELIVKLCAGIDTRETGLICELMAALLAKDLDLPVANPRLVEIDAGFDKAIPLPEAAAIVRKSTGCNFGSQKLANGANTWPKDKPIPMLLRPLAAEILAFDVIVQNPDRRRDNPNLLWKGDELFIYDHDLAFSFVSGVIDWQPPWTGQGLEFLRDHVFYDGMQGSAISWERLTGAFDAVDDRRLEEYVNAVPQPWVSKSHAAKQIATYLKDARENIGKITTVLTRMLQ